MDAKSYSDRNAHFLDCIRLCTLCLELGDSGRSDTLLSEADALWTLIERRESASDARAELTLPAVRRALSLDDCGYFCVMFALCCELDGALRSAVQKRCASLLPTFDFVLSIFSAYRRIPTSALFACPNPGASSLRFALGLERGFTAAQPLLAAPLLLRRNILHFLVSGFPSPNRDYEIADFRGLDALPLHERAYRAAEVYIAEAAAGASKLCFFLSGAAGSGKRTLIKRLAAAHEVPCVFLDCGPLETRSAERLEELSIELAADLVLTGAMLCLFNCSADRATQIQTLLRELPETGVPLFLLSEASAPPTLVERTPLSFPLSALTGDEYGAAWARFRSPHAVDPPLADAADYRLNVGQLEQMWARAAHICRRDGRERVCERDLADAVRQLNATSEYSTPLRTATTLDDLVVSPETMARLRLICDFARQSRTVGHSWGFEARLPYGRGITALLCGASGTGKTMAAAAIANELGLELLRLDLSQILDKYIGETEKKLAAVFDAASRGNFVLFFDEADALFSKRTEISSSHDRYANVETSFLLQSIEQYDGIVLLATNLFKNFDEAFLRRIGILVRFSMPDEALRRTLWESVFPPEAPLAPGLDFALLARELELSPAIIKSSARCAAVAAAAEGAAIGMRHILFGLRGDLEKYGQESRLTVLETLCADETDR